MRLFFIVLLLLTYLNIYLVPNLSEVDTFVAGTDKINDDINSFYELVNILLGYDTTSDDEDSDTGMEDNSNINTKDLIKKQLCSSLNFRIQILLILQRGYINFNQLNLPLTFLKIDTPPPKV